jgi:predicted nucleotidyltransferase
LYNENAVFEESRDLKEVRRIVLNGLSGRRARVYLFGSWARGEASRVSDIDVAILADEPLPPDVRADIEEALENSLSVYPVDLVDLCTASEPFRSRVLAEGIPWTD